MNERDPKSLTGHAAEGRFPSVAQAIRSSGARRMALMLALTAQSLGGCGGKSPVADSVAPEPLVVAAEFAAVESLNDLDLTFLGPDSIIGVVVAPKTLFERPWAQDPNLRASLEKLLAPETLASKISWQKCDRISIAIAMPEAGASEPPLVVRTQWSEAVDAKDFLEASESLQLRQEGGIEFWEEAESGIAIWQENPTTIWWGSVERLKQLPTRSVPNHRLARALASRPLTSDLEAVVDLAVVRQTSGALGTAGTGSDSQQAALEAALEKAKTLEIIVDTSKDQFVIAKAMIGDAQLAEGLRKWGRGRISQATAALTTLAALQLSRFPEDVGSSATRLLAAIAQGIKVEANEGEVCLSLTVSPDLRSDVAVLVGYGVAQQQKERERANLELIAKAFGQYVAEHNDLPRDIRDAEGNLLLSWRIHLLPYLGQQELYDAIAQDESWQSETNRPLLEQMPAVFGSDPMGQTRFLALTSESAALSPSRSGLPVDGVEQTLVVLQVNSAQQEPWLAPGGLMEFKASQLKAMGEENDFVWGITADGKTHQLSRWIRERDLDSLLTAEGGEEVDTERVFPQEAGGREERSLLNLFPGR